MKGLIISLLIALSLAHLATSVSLDENFLVKADTGDEKKVKALNLFDIDDVVSEIAAKKNLKLAATMLSKNSLTYNIRGHMDRKLTLKVNKSKDSYDVHLDDEANAAPLSLKVPNKAYYTSEIKSFLDNNISKTARPVARKLELGSLMTILTEALKKKKDIAMTEDKDTKTSGKLTITVGEPKKQVFMRITDSNGETKCELSTWKEGENNKTAAHRIHTFKAKGDTDQNKIVEQIILFFDAERPELIKESETYAIINDALGAKCDKKTGDLQRCIFTVDKTATSKTQPFFILDMGNGKSRISLEKSDENLLIELDTFAAPNQVEEIRKSLEVAANANVPIENLENKIQEAITKSNDKCNFPGLDKITKDKTYVSLTIESKTKPNDKKEESKVDQSCIMAESQLTMTVYDIKPLNHMHLKLDNEFLAIEAVLNIKDETFNIKVKKYIDSFSTFTKEISSNKSEGADLDRLTVTNVIEALKKEYTDINKLTLPCTFTATGCEVTVGNQKYDMINVTEVGSDIRISMMSPISNDTKGSFVPNHPTIILKTLNGYNQLKVVIGNITEFIQECNKNGGIGINKAKK